MSALPARTDPNASLRPLGDQNADVVLRIVAREVLATDPSGLIVYPSNCRPLNSVKAIFPFWPGKAAWAALTITPTSSSPTNVTDGMQCLTPPFGREFRLTRLRRKSTWRPALR